MGKSLLSGLVAYSVLCVSFLYCSQFSVLLKYTIMFLMDSSCALAANDGEAVTALFRQCGDTSGQHSIATEHWL